MTYPLSLEVTREEDLWMARTAAIQGFLVTGEMPNQLFHEVPEIAQAQYESCREQGWTFIKDAPNAQPKDIVWVFEVPDLKQQSAIKPV